MNEDIVKGNWKQLSGKIKAKWGKLTDNDLEKAEGNKEYLLGKLQEHYGLAKDKAEQNLKDLGHV
ncbi:MAG: CsbD family protein [Sulfuricaulis sp.]|uniref:CsbD family protein n=1 Tax=Sulfuricaulis sp. TaxID=2003553 RepID=UPI003C67BC78